LPDLPRRQTPWTDPEGDRTGGVRGIAVCGRPGVRGWVGRRVMALPYENATSGKNAVADMQKLLRGFGAASFGVMEEFDKGEVIVQFTYRTRNVTIRASFKGYAAAWLKHHPMTSRTRGTRVDYERRALQQAQLSVYSILRDWIKGQVTAIEVGMMSFEGAFLGQILLSTGETVLQRIEATDMLRIEAE
jgi:hypothetical protein